MGAMERVRRAISGARQQIDSGWFGSDMGADLSSEELRTLRDGSADTGDFGEEGESDDEEIILEVFRKDDSKLPVCDCGACARVRCEVAHRLW